VTFTITPHAKSGAPDDALDRLFERIGSRSGDMRFRRTAREIHATPVAEAPSGMEEDVLADIGRRALLKLISDVCEGSPDMRFEWYAVAPRRY
jgi:hypothetical protein